MQQSERSPQDRLASQTSAMEATDEILQARQDVFADPALVRALTLHQTVLNHGARGITKEEIFQRVEGYILDYRESEKLNNSERARTLDALERRFSRDKDRLRASGIPLEESEDVTGEHRYSIHPQSYGLSTVDLTAAEYATLFQAVGSIPRGLPGLGHAIWAVTTSESADESSLRSSVDGASTDEDPSQAQAAQTQDLHTGQRHVVPVSLTDETEVDRVLEVSRLGLHKPVTFDYTGRGRLYPTPRRVIPLQLAARGHWYMLGHDIDRDGLRLFRLDRIYGSIKRLARRSLTAEEKTRAEERAQAKAVSAAEVLQQLDSSPHWHSLLEGVVIAHTGPAPEPGRLRRPQAEPGRDDAQLKTERVLNMTAYLLSHDSVRPSQLLDLFALRPDQLLRDLLSIEQSGPNVLMSRYLTVEPQLPWTVQEFTEEYLARDEPLQLIAPDGPVAQTLPQPASMTKPGALGLLIAVKTLLARTDSDAEAQTDILASLQKKLLAIAPADIATAAEDIAVISPQVVDPRRQKLLESIAADAAVDLDYIDASGNASTRVIEPVEIIDDGATGYLRAYCRQALGERLFRISRIQNLTQRENDPVSTEAIALREEPTPAPAAPVTSSDSGRPSHAELGDVVLRFAPFATGRVERFAPRRQRRDPSDGSLFIETSFSSTQAAITLCLEAGGDIEVVTPTELREAVLEAAQKKLTAQSANT